ncbi:hypothetical protein BB561_001342 [Smittium simulii]|uniref:Uncharacterized protein n=1 Tax=Smittium simulii TaxID=133385 RepID=A0A2T9YV01_9FUNG|nr:hypothetical protein BB561_001342 [Smittium simulii]
MDQNNLTNLISNLAEQLILLIARNAETQQAAQRIQRGQQDQPIQTYPVEVKLPHVVARAPVTDLIYYSELLGVNTLVGEDFFRSRLPEEDNSEEAFSLEVKLLLADASSNIARLRRELVYKTMGLLKKASKLAEKTEDSLFEPEQFDTIVETKKKKQRKTQTKSRRKREEQGLSVETLNTSPVGGLERGFKIPFNPTYSPKFKVQKKVRKKASTAISENNLALYQIIYRLGQELQDEIPDICMQNNQEERLHDIFESRGCVSTHTYTLKLQKIPEVYVKRDEPTVQSSPIRTITEPTHIKQNFEAHVDKSKKKREVIENYRTINPTLRNDHQFKINGFKGTNKQDSGLETRSCKTIENRQDNSKRIRQFYWESSSNVCCASTRSIFFEEKQENRELLQLVQGHTSNRNKRTPTLLEEMEKPILLPAVELNSSSITESDTRENNINNNNFSLDFGNMVSNTDQACNIGPSKDRSVRDSARPKKRKITTNPEQDMVFNSAENQWSTLQEKLSNKEMLEKKCFNELMDYLNDTSIISANNKYFNIGKVMGYFNIHIIGFLRERNIPRIDGACTEVLEHSLKLIIEATKEKKRGSPIEKISKFARALCPRPHFNNKNLTVNHLFRNSRDYNKQLSVDSISR